MAKTTMPARALKAMQRYVIAAKLQALPIHPIATAYRAGRSIADNAAPHAGKRVILKLDFRDFFTSITPGDLTALLDDARFDTISADDRIMLTAILFEVGKLIIGIYIGKLGLTSTYGAAASLVVVLIWVYYNAQIVLLGAEFTHVYAKRRAARSLAWSGWADAALSRSRPEP